MPHRSISLLLVPCMVLTLTVCPYLCLGRAHGDALPPTAGHATILAPSFNGGCCGCGCKASPPRSSSSRGSLPDRSPPAGCQACICKGAVVRAPDVPCHDLSWVSFAVVVDGAASAEPMALPPIAGVGEASPGGGHSSGRMLRLHLASLLI